MAAFARLNPEGSEMDAPTPVVEADEVVEFGSEFWLFEQTGSRVHLLPCDMDEGPAWAAMALSSSTIDHRLALSRRRDLDFQHFYRKRRLALTRTQCERLPPLSEEQTRPYRKPLVCPTMVTDGMVHVVLCPTWEVMQPIPRSTGMTYRELLLLLQTTYPGFACAAVQLGNQLYRIDPAEKNGSWNMEGLTVVCTVVLVADSPSPPTTPLFRAGFANPVLQALPKLPLDDAYHVLFLGAPGCGAMPLVETYGRTKHDSSDDWLCARVPKLPGAHFWALAERADIGANGWATSWAALLRGLRHRVRVMWCQPYGERFETDANRDLIAQLSRLLLLPAVGMLDIAITGGPPWRGDTRQLMAEVRLYGASVANTACMWLMGVPCTYWWAGGTRQYHDALPSSGQALVSSEASRMLISLQEQHGVFFYLMGDALPRASPQIRSPSTKQERARLLSVAHVIAHALDVEFLLQAIDRFGTQTQLAARLEENLQSDLAQLRTVSLAALFDQDRPFLEQAVRALRLY